MASAIAFAPVGTHLRELWVTLAKTFSIRGDEVYFFDPNPLLRRLLKQEGLIDTIIRFDDGRTAPLPISTDRDVYIVDHNLRNLNKNYDTIQSEYDNFRYYFNQLDIDVCVFWNDYRSPGAISPDKHDVKCLYMENGYMPETIQIDSAGVNHNTTVAGQSKADTIKREPPREVPSELDVAKVEPMSLTDMIMGFGVKAFTNSSAAFRSLKHRIPVHEELLPELDSQPTLPESFVFVPFQVHDDTQIRYNSPLVDDMRKFLTVVRQAVDAVAPEQTVVVKEHPVDLHRMDYDHLRSQFSDVCWFTEYPIEELITKANTVVTINSSVGFQSIAEGTPVVTVGLSLYDSAPNVWSVNELNEIDEALNAALISNPDDDLVAEYVEAVQDVLFVPGTPDEFSDETIHHIVGYIDYLCRVSSI